jgi:Terminase RNaseH-like domain/Terminase large subunit, T4likevirus-type, N-terminal
METGTEKALRLDKRAVFASLAYEPHPGQLEVHTSPAKLRVVACGVRWGKTLCAAMEGLAAALEPAERSVGWVVAPTYDLADRVYRQIVYSVGTHLRHRLIACKEHEKSLLIRNMSGGVSEIRAKSADNPVSLLGEGLDWLIIDEAARLKPVIWESHLSQRLIDKKGWALLISTPHGKGWLYDLFRRGLGADADYRSWNYPSWTNPLLDRAVIERERDKLPERVFRQEYAAEFLEGSGAVFRNVRECATGEFKEPVEGADYFAGLDLAKVEDFTVFVVLDEELRVVFLDRFHRLDWSTQVTRIKAASDRYFSPRIHCDTTGAGEPIYEDLREADCYVKEYPFTTRSKSDLVNNLALLLEKKKIVLPRPEICPELVDELESYEFSVTDTGHVRTGAPYGYHDDTVIALALAAWRAERCTPFAMWVG